MNSTIDRDTLRNLVADVLDVDPSVVTDDAHFVNDLDGDAAEQASSEIDGETAVFAGDMS